MRKHGDTFALLLLFFLRLLCLLFGRRFLAHARGLSTASRLYSLNVRTLRNYKHADRRRKTGTEIKLHRVRTDLLYVLLGTYVAHGLQDYAEALFDEVHRSNMSKLDENGRPIHRDDGKVLKSRQYSAPDIQGVLFPRTGRS